MKKRASDNLWIPFWIDKWIFGSMRIEFNLEERAVWVDLLALGAKDNGYIRANEETPYPLKQLAGMLIIPEDILESSIEKFIKKDKLHRYDNGVLYIKKWEKYQFTERYRRGFKQDSSLKTEQCSSKGEAISNKNNKSKQNKEREEAIANIIKYLNEKSGKNFKKDVGDHINARLEDNYTINNLKKVIDVKVSKWKNDPKMDDYLRPTTLFCKKNFEAYLNERMTIKNMDGKTKMDPYQASKLVKD